MFRPIPGILEHINKCKAIKIYLWGGGGGGGVKTIMGGFPYLIGRCSLSNALGDGVKYFPFMFV